MQNKKHLLLIDDDEDDLFFFQQALQRIDIPFHFSSTNDSEVALKHLQDKIIPAPDFIFLDLNMPKINGMEFLSAIKKLPHLAAIPIIIYTTSDSDKEKEEALKLGAVHFLSKPPHFEELCQRLKSFFSQIWNERSS
jgi:CheY-like chemotaxis protein